MWSRIWMCVALVLGLSGCAGYPEARGFTHEKEVIATLGQPTRVWHNDDGSRTLEYATQPNGSRCWMYTVTTDGRVTHQHDALSDANLARVEKGMSVAEVQRLLGQHRSIQRFALSGEEVWDWTITGDYSRHEITRFNVHFIDGKVVRTSRSVEYPRDGVMFNFGIGHGHGSGLFWGLGWGWPWRPHAW